MHEVMHANVSHKIKLLKELDSSLVRNVIAMLKCIHDAFRWKQFLYC